MATRKTRAVIEQVTAVGGGPALSHVRWAWRVEAPNGRVVARSGEPYASKLHAIRLARMVAEGYAEGRHRHAEVRPASDTYDTVVQ